MTKHVPPPSSHAGSTEAGRAALFARIGEGAAERDRERRHPYDAIGWLKEARFGAIRLPRENGGEGASVRELLFEVIALGSADPNVAHILRNHFVFVERFARNPVTAVERGWQERVAAGAIFGLAAGELGKTVSTASMETSLVPHGTGYLLNGLKYYSTGNLYADFILVRARIDADTLASAIIPRDRAGLELVDDWDGVGQRLTGTGTTRLNDVRVEAQEVIIDSDGSGYRQPHGMVLPQLFLTAVLAGILRNVVADAASLVRSRGGRSFVHAVAERPADDPLLQHVVGQISALAFAGEATVLAAGDALERVTRSADSGPVDELLAHDASLAAAKAKIVLDEAATRAAGLLFDVGGASATKQSRNLDRHWRNARTLASHNPSLYKTQAIGAFEVNGTPVPRTGFF